ncbi:MAG: hypothetical protein V4581_01110 [Bacteroidota bacterium]
MKITKMLLLALSLSLFSCSQEDVQTTPDTHTASNLRTAAGIKDSEVKRLTAKCLEISKSVEYLDKKAKGIAFAGKMHNVFLSNWHTRNDVANWLSSNLSQTEFSTVNEGLLALDNLNVATKKYLVANQAFFNDLWPANTAQIRVILHPIITAPGLPVLATNSCDDDCLDQYQSDIELALDGWIGDMEFGDYSGQTSYYNHADANFTFFMQSAEQAAWNCFDACD